MVHYPTIQPAHDQPDCPTDAASPPQQPQQGPALAVGPPQPTAALPQRPHHARPVQPEQPPAGPPDGSQLGLYPSDQQPMLPDKREQAETALRALRAAATQQGGARGAAAYSAWTLQQLAGDAEGRELLWEVGHRGARGGVEASHVGARLPGQRWDGRTKAAPALAPPANPRCTCCAALNCAPPQRRPAGPSSCPAGQRHPSGHLLAGPAAAAARGCRAGSSSACAVRYAAAPRGAGRRCALLPGDCVSHRLAGVSGICLGAHAPGPCTAGDPPGAWGPRHAAHGHTSARPRCCHAGVAASISQCGGLHALVAQLTAPQPELRAAACRALFYLGWMGSDLRCAQVLMSVSTTEVSSLPHAKVALPAGPALWVFADL